ncbi:hypothetical protein GCM10009647_033830 [Streptomyces sanglieri]|uniref:hypothetical protein n=1 Tax=Streptomyces sp. Wh19 TaxID=3076629 RepID=UPI002958B40B|nr:hypothetical protein [Streptomyces sp. Wh19]MDV9200644.1 hypothetical protein [Streptomyces sp. Wh19]
MRAKNKMRAAGLTVAGLCVTGLAVAGGMAIAATTSSQAPYAQAGALVKADGSIVHSKGVSEVTKSGHVYCVKISNDDVDLSRAIVTATPRDGIGYTLRAIAGGCANGKGVQVATYNADAGGAATAFYVAVL